MLGSNPGKTLRGSYICCNVFFFRCNCIKIAFLFHKSNSFESFALKSRFAKSRRRETHSSLIEKCVLLSDLSRLNLMASPRSLCAGLVCTHDTRSFWLRKAKVGLRKAAVRKSRTKVRPENQRTAPCAGERRACTETAIRVLTSMGFNYFCKISTSFDPRAWESRLFVAAVSLKCPRVQLSVFNKLDANATRSCSPRRHVERRWSSDWDSVKKRERCGECAHKFR